MKRSKRILSTLLILLLIMGLHIGTEIFMPVAMAADEGTTIDAFGIEMAEWTEQQKEEATSNSPFGSGLGNSTSVLTYAELYANLGYDGNTRHSGRYDWNNKGGIGEYQSSIKNFSLNGMSKTSGGYMFMETAAMDLDGTGKDEYIAKLAFSSSGSMLHLFVTDTNNVSKTNTVLVASGEGINHLEKLSSYQFRGAISLVAGDFDGDGKDSLLVYIPALASGQHPCIWEYKVENGRLVRGVSLTEDVYGLIGVSGIKDLNRNNPDDQAMVAMEADDIDKDGYDELVLTVSMNDADGTNGSPKLGSQLFVYDMLNNKWNQSYKLELSTEAGKGAADANRIVWASASIGNMILESGTSTGVDFPEIIAAGYKDNSGGWDIDVPAEDDLGVVMVKIDANKPIKEEVDMGIGKSKNIIANYGLAFQQSFRPNDFTVDGFFEEDNVNSYLQVQSFASRGFSYAEDIFISGTIYRVNDQKSGLDAVYTPDYFTKADNSGSFGRNCVQDVVAASFEGHCYGKEQLIFATALKQEGNKNCHSQLFGTYSNFDPSRPESDSNTDNWETFNSGYLVEHKDRYYITLEAIDIDDDGLTLTLDDVERTYSEPDVLAILEAPPYFKEIEDGDTGNSATTYGTSTSSGSGSSNSFGFSAGVTAGYEVDGLFTGAGFETTIENSFNWSTANSTTKEWAIDYSNDTGENLVVVYRCPVVSYRYLDQNGKELLVCRTEQPATSMISVDEYNDAAAFYGLELIGDEVLGSPGNPFSYRSSTAGLSDAFDSTTSDVETSIDGWVQYNSLGTTTQTLTLSEEEEKTFEYELDISVEVWGKVGGLKTGVSAGVNYGYSDTSVNGSSVTKSGAVTGQQVDGYDFQWKFITFMRQINNNRIPVLGYMVKNTVAPPSPPESLSVETVGTDNVTLSWDLGQRAALQYRIYRVLDDSSNPYVLVGAADGSETSYKLTGLTPGKTYTYVVKAVGYSNGKLATSVASSPVTVRTMSDDANDVRITLSGTDDNNVLYSDGSYAELSAIVYNPGVSSSTNYRWQMRTGSNGRWVDLSNGDNEGIGSVSGATGSNLILSNLETDSLQNSALRCIVIVASLDGTLEYYYSPIASLSLSGNPTKTSLNISGYKDGSGEPNDPYTGYSAYNEISTNYIDVKQQAPVIVEVDNQDYTIYSYSPDPQKPDENMVYVALTYDSNGLARYYKASKSGGSYTVDTSTELKAKGRTYYYSKDGVDTVYTTLPAGFDGYTEERASVVTGDGDNQVTTTYIRSYLMDASGPKTEYWYNTTDGAYYTRTLQDGTYVYTKLVTQPTDDDDVRTVYNTTAANTIIVGQSGTAEATAYNTYEIYTKSGDTYSLVTIWAVNDGSLYATGDSKAYADCNALTELTQEVTVKMPVTDNTMKSGEQLVLNAAVNKDGGDSVSTTVDYVITHIPSGVVTTLVGNSGSPINWSASSPGLYQITATARKTNSSLSSSDTCYYYARDVKVGDEEQTEYRLVVEQRGTTVSNITYNGLPVSLKLQSRAAVGVNETPNIWNDITSDVTYTINNQNLSGASYTPDKAGNYSFSAVVNGDTVAKAQLTVNKAAVTLSPYWEDMDDPNSNMVPNYSDISVKATNGTMVGNDASLLNQALVIVCDLYDDNGSIKDVAGAFNVSIGWKKEADGSLTAAASTLQSRYTISLTEGVINNLGDSMIVSYGSGENGIIKAVYADVSGSEFSFASGSSLPTDSNVMFTATPSSGYIVDKWTVNGKDVVDGEITNHANNGQTLRFNLGSYVQDGNVDVQVTFTNSTSTITFDPGENGKLEVTDGSGNKISSGTKVSYGANVNFTAIPDDGYMIDYWLVDGEVYTWPETGETYRSDVLVLENIDDNHDVSVSFVKEASTKVAVSVVDTQLAESSAATVDVSDSDGTVLQPDNDIYTVRQDETLIFTVNPVAGSDNTVIREWQYSTNGKDWDTVVNSGGKTSLTIHNFSGDEYYLRAVVTTAQNFVVKWNIEGADTDANASLKAFSNGIELVSGESQPAYTKIDFELTLDDSYYVVGWSKNVQPNGKKASIESLSADTQVTVTVAKKPIITINEDDGGSAVVKGTVNGVADTVLNNGDYVDNATDVIVVLNPDKGYMVDGRIQAEYTDGNGHSTDSKTYTIENVTKDTEVDPIWDKIDNYNIDYLVVDLDDDKIGDFGKMSVDVERKGMGAYATDEDRAAATDGTTTVYDKGTITFTATPDTGYRIKEWTVNGEVYKVNEMTFTGAVLSLIPTDDMTVGVQFEQGAPEIRFDQPANGALSAVTPTDDGSTEPFTSGGNTVLPVTFTVTPNEHYEVKEWTVNGNVQEDADGNVITDETFTLQPSGNAVVDVVLWGEELDANVNDLNGGTADISGDIRYAENITINATPDDGYVVESIKVEGSDTNLYTNTNKENGKQSVDYEIFENTKFVVTFSQKPVVTYSASNGTITANGTVDGATDTAFDSGDYVDFNTEVTFSAKADTGYLFDGWYIEGEKVEDADTTEYTCTVNSNVNVEARFTATPDLKVSYSVSDDTLASITATQNGRGFDSGDLLAGGVKVVLTVDPKEGYRVADWEGLPQDAIVSADKNTVTIEALTDALEVKAVMEAIPQRTITIEAPNHGKIEATVNGKPISSGDTVSDGTEVTFKAIADANWMFDKWTGDADGQIGNTITLTVTSDIKVGAEFAEATYYSVQYSVVGDGGTISGHSDEQDIAVDTKVQLVGGSKIELIAAPESGKMVKEWTVNGQVVNKDNLTDLGLSMYPVGNTLTLDYLANNVEITVEFEDYVGFEIPADGSGYTITDVVREPDDTLPDNEIRRNGSLSFKVVPAAGAAISSVVVNNSGTAVVNPDGSWTVNIADVQSDIELKVTAVQGIPINITAGANGTLSVTRNDVELSPSDALSAGDKLVVKASPANGYVLDKLTINGTDFANGGTYTVTGDEAVVMINATFKEKPAGGGGGGGTAVTNYNINVVEAENGKVEVSDNSAAENQNITITVNPAEGYILKNLVVTDADGGNIEFKDAGENKYTFSMPGSDVTIKAEFAKDNHEDCPSASFIDIEREVWYHEAVDYVIENNLMTGVSDNLFAPNDTLTRGMIVTILWRLEGEPQAESQMSFTDVAEGKWYAEAVNWAASQGIVSGVSESMYEPESNLTREQMSAILYRYAKYSGIDTESKDDYLNAFNDGDLVSDYAVNSINWAIENNLIKGVDDATLDPGGTATRAQVAAVLMRFCENILDLK
jgi:hypothetical protein